MLSKSTLYQPCTYPKLFKPCIGNVHNLPSINPVHNIPKIVQTLFTTYPGYFNSYTVSTKFTTYPKVFHPVSTLFTTFPELLNNCLSPVHNIPRVLILVTNSLRTSFSCRNSTGKGGSWVRWVPVGDGDQPRRHTMGGVRAYVLTRGRRARPVNTQHARPLLSPQAQQGVHTLAIT